MTIGCCGYGGPRRFSLSGFLAEADAYPPSSPQGQAARARLAYGIAAGKAAQAGNRPAYERAMRGLAGLGTGSPETGYHGTQADATAARAALQTAARQAQSSLTGDLATARSVLNIVLGAAQIGTGIGSAACNGCDRTGIDAVNLVISLVRAILTPGAVLDVPEMSPATLNGFVGFCSYKDAIKGGIRAAIGLGMVAAINNTGVTNALTSIQAVLLGLIDSICNIPQIQLAIAAALAPPPPPPEVPAAPVTRTTLCWNGSTMTQTWDPATSRWGAATPACPAPPPAIGLQAGNGGCRSGQFNLIPPAGILNPTTGAAVPGTAGAKSCAACSAPAVFIPGVVDARGFWATPPGCQNPATGAIISAPRTGPCPAGTSRTSSGGCAGAAGGGGGGSGGSSKAIPLAAAAAAAAWFFFK